MQSGLSIVVVSFAAKTDQSLQLAADNEDFWQTHHGSGKRCRPYCGDAGGVGLAWNDECLDRYRQQPGRHRVAQRKPESMRSDFSEHLLHGVGKTEFILPTGMMMRFGCGGDADFELTVSLACLLYGHTSGTERMDTMADFVFGVSQ